ncbi:hypothetical protein NDU88_001888, partial [Pleurodeles waltl]
TPEERQTWAPDHASEEGRPTLRAGSELLRLRRSRRRVPPPRRASGNRGCLRLRRREVGRDRENLRLARRELGEVPGPGVRGARGPN